MRFQRNLKIMVDIRKEVIHNLIAGRNGTAYTATPDYESRLASLVRAGIGASRLVPWEP